MHIFLKISENFHLAPTEKRFNENPKFTESVASLCRAVPLKHSETKKGK